MNQLFESDSEPFRHHSGQRRLGYTGNELIGGLLVSIDLDLQKLQVVDRRRQFQFPGVVQKVRGDQSQRACAFEKPQYQREQLDPFRRIGPRAKFIQDDERRRLDRVEHRADPQQLTAEATL